MKIFQKYKQLQDKQYLVKMLTDNVYATMQLENQPVSKNKLEEMALSMVNEESLKGFKFAKD